MLLKELATLIESDSQQLTINLNTKKISGPIELLKQLKADDVDEVDLDEVEEDSEGNLEGALLIWIGDKSVEVTGGHFSPMWTRYSVLKTKTERQKVIDELVTKINRELNLI